MEKTYIAVGSNKGDRAANVLSALKHIRERVLITKISSFIRTSPQEGARGGFFINGIIEGKTGLSPAELFRFLQNIEKKNGRSFPHAMGDEREIDLDIIFYGEKVIKTGEIIIPHPRYMQRRFVVNPLYEIAPGLTDPRTGDSIRNIYGRLNENEGHLKDIRGQGRDKESKGRR